MDTPPDDAYSRVTDPERFRPLHAFAEGIIDALRLSFEAEVTREARTVSIIPVGGGAPIVFEFTDFPGVRLRYGEWHEAAFPGCGCDACSEDPFGVSKELMRKVDAVTGGAFQEWVEKDWLYHSTGSESGGRSLEFGGWPEGLPRDYRSDWKPWVRLRHW